MRYLNFLGTYCRFFMTSFLTLCQNWWFCLKSKGGTDSWLYWRGRILLICDEFFLFFIWFYIWNYHLEMVSKLSWTRNISHGWLRGSFMILTLCLWILKCYHLGTLRWNELRGVSELKEDFGNLFSYSLFSLIHSCWVFIK